MIQNNVGIIYLKKICCHRHSHSCSLTLYPVVLFSVTVVTFHLHCPDSYSHSLIIRFLSLSHSICPVLCPCTVSQFFNIICLSVSVVYLSVCLFGCLPVYLCVSLTPLSPPPPTHSISLSVSPPFSP